GLALIIGVIINYLLLSKGDPLLLFSGVALVTVAILLNAIAFRMHAGNQKKTKTRKWIVVSIVAGSLISTFYHFVASAMIIENFVSPAEGKLTPYTAFVLFAY